MNDMESQRLEWYHLQGYTAHGYLAELRRERQKLYEDMTATQQKADNIREYLKQMSF